MKQINFLDEFYIQSHQFMIINKKTDMKQLNVNLNILNDKDVQLFLGFDSNMEEELRTICHRIFEQKNFVYYQIFKDGVFVGLFYLYNIHHKYARANISLGIVPDRRGHLLSIHCVKELICYLFDLGFIRIGVEIEDTNEKSLKLMKHLEKIGFVYEGKLRDHYGENIHSNVWSLLKREYMKKEDSY